MPNTPTNIRYNPDPITLKLIDFLLRLFKTHFPTDWGKQVH